MGIHGRDYMKRESNVNDYDSSADEKAEAMLGGLLGKYPRLPWIIAIVIGTLVLLGLILVFK